ncbi:hypothetical protein CPB85DRAFT_1562047 [Mucidula mucida]|nr:hypothetical protein CPB85DRAFT_1562047 [Mucidula mucida]
MMSARNVNYTRPIAAYAPSDLYMPPTAVYSLPNGRVILSCPPSYNRPAALVEIHGTTYFTQNLKTEESGIKGSYEHQGTVYFPQRIERAPIPSFVEEQQPEVNTIPGSYERNGTVYFPQPFERAPVSIPIVEEQKPEVDIVPGSYVLNGTTFFVPQEELTRAKQPLTPALTDACSLSSSNPSSSEVSPDTTNFELPVKGDIDASAMEYIEGAVYMGRRRSAY